MPVQAVHEIHLNPAEVRQGLHLSRERMGHILRVSAKTVEHWESRNASCQQVVECNKEALRKYLQMESSQL